MHNYSFNIESAAGLHEAAALSPSEFLDRLSDAVDDERVAPSLLSLAMTVDQETGAVTLIFETPADDVRAAVEAAFSDVARLFARALGKAIDVGARIDLDLLTSDPPVKRLEVERSDDREPVPA